MTQTRLRLIACLAFGLLALLPLFPSSARAQDAAPAFVLAPSGEPGPYFNETMTPGERKTLTALLGNAGSAPVKARTYAANAYSLINGGFGVRGEDVPAAGPTSWLDYPAESLTLAPGTQVERAFTVTVPKTAKPGQYLSALVLQSADAMPVNGSAMLKQIVLKSIAVFITVPGPVQPVFTVGPAAIEATPSGRVLKITVANQGNVLVKPAGTLTLRDATGAVAMTAPVKMDSVYAGLSTTLELPIAAGLAPGNYVVSIELTDAATGAAATAEKLAVTAPDPNAATPAPDPVTITSVALDPVRDGAGKLKFVNVTVAIANSSDPVANARLTLHVTRDGAPVEDFAMAASLSLPRGVTQIPARYLPASDWQAGSYGFSVTLESVNPSSGQATVIATAAAPETVTGP